MKLVTVAVVVGLVSPSNMSGQTAPKQWTLRPDLRIGNVEGPDALTGVHGFEVDAPGNMYLLQALEGQILTFDTHGKPVGTIGRRGRGPGEFQAPTRMGWRGDTLWVLDAALRRITFWSGSSPARMVSLPDVSVASNMRVSLVSVLSDGRLLLGALPQSDNDGRRVERYGTAFYTQPDGTQRVELARLRVSDSPVIDPDRNSRIAMSYQPFADATLLRTSPDGESIVVVERPAANRAGETAFSVVRLSARGDTLFRRQIRYRPLRLTRQVIDQVIRIPSVRITRRFPSSEAARKAIRDALFLPRYQPPVSDLVVGRDQSVWLRREDTGRATTEWMVLSPRGELLGTVAVPSGAKILQAQTDRIWGVEQDEFDVQQVVRYQVERPTG